MARYASSLQSCPTPCNPVDSSPPGSSVHDGTLQARILEWVAIHSSGDLPYPGNKATSPVSSPGAGRFLTTRLIWEALAKFNFKLFFLAGLLSKLVVFNSTCKKEPVLHFQRKKNSS